jgi:hypothetical protein
VAVTRGGSGAAPAHLQPRVEQAEGVALRQQHEQRVQAAQQRGVAARLQQLQAQEREARRLQQRHEAVHLQDNNRRSHRADT